MKIAQFLSKPYRWAIVFSIILTCFLVFALLDVFVIPKALVYGEPSPTENAKKARKPLWSISSLASSFWRLAFVCFAYESHLFFGDFSESTCYAMSRSNTK